MVEMKKLTSFEKSSVSTLGNERFRVEGRNQRIGSSLAYKVCLRTNLEKPPMKEQPAFRHFERKRPNNLIQSDLTQFDNFPIIAMENDHSRHVWSQVIGDESALTVTAAMRELVPYRFNNLLRAYNLSYNNGRRHRITKGIPAKTYLGEKDEGWFREMMRVLKGRSYAPSLTAG